MWPAFEELEFHPLIHLEKPKTARRRSLAHAATQCAPVGHLSTEELRLSTLLKASSRALGGESLQFSISPGLVRGSRSHGRMVWRPPGAVVHPRANGGHQRLPPDGALCWEELHRAVLRARRTAGELRAALCRGTQGGGGALQRGLPRARGAATSHEGANGAA